MLSSNVKWIKMTKKKSSHDKQSIPYISCHFQWFIQCEWMNEWMNMGLNEHNELNLFHWHHSICKFLFRKPIIFGDCMLHARNAPCSVLSVCRVVFIASDIFPFALPGGLHSPSSFNAFNKLLFYLHLSLVCHRFFFLSCFHSCKAPAAFHGIKHATMNMYSGIPWQRFISAELFFFPLLFMYLVSLPLFFEWVVACIPLHGWWKKGHRDKDEWHDGNNGNSKWARLFSHRFLVDLVG